MPLQAMQRALTGGRGVLHVYHPLGFPGPGLDAAYLDAAVEAGAEVLELGLPFSDPVADGPVLQRASQQALAAGATTTSALATMQALRRRHPQVGIIAMAYANSLHRMSWSQAASALATAGADGVIVPDMPLREARVVQPGFAQRGVAWIPLIASTVPPATVRAAGRLAPPFIYAASLGVTGQAGPGPEAQQALLHIRREAPATAVAVGFGVRDADDARRLRTAGAHGVVVGSALVRRILEGGTAAQHGAAVAALREACA